MRKFILLIGFLTLLCGVSALYACSSGSEEDRTVATWDDDDDDDAPPINQDDDASTDDDDNGDDDNDDDDDDDDNDDDDDTFPDEACEGDSQPHTITFTSWVDLPQPIKQMIFDGFADAGVAPDFYGRFVYWYGIMRESFRALRDYYNTDYPQSRWQEESIAAEMAISYIRERNELQLLYMLENRVQELYENIDNPVPVTMQGQEEEYFNNNEADIVADPLAFFWFQLHWALQAIDADNDKSFGNRLVARICLHVDPNADYTPQPFGGSFNSTDTAFEVFNMIGIDVAVFELRHDPQLVLQTGTTQNLLDYL